MSDRIPPHLISHTPRSRNLASLRAYYNGTQYDGMPDFWTGTKANGETVPVRERAPLINYRLARSAVGEVVKFALGEGRFPRIKVEPDTEILPGTSLTKEESKQLAAFITALIEHAHIKPLWCEALCHGLSTGTAGEIVSLRGGKFHSEMLMAEHCDVEFDECGEVVRLTQCYQYDKVVAEKGSLLTKRYYYRREVDTTYDTIYKPVEVRGYDEPEWTIDVPKAHDLGFCPVNWGRNDRRIGCPDLDGISLYEGDEDEIDQLNMALSHRSRGIHFWGAPQPWEAGVAKDEKVAGLTRTARPKRDDPYGGGRPFYEKPARRTGVDEIWSFEDAQASAGLLETTGKAFEAATKHVNDIRGRVAESMSVVLPDLSVIVGKGDISARLLTMLYAPLLGKVDSVRECWWPGFFRKSLEMRLRMVSLLAGKERILLPGVTEASAILSRFAVDDLWLPPVMTPVWGAYFSPTSTEAKGSVDAASAAEQAGYITKRTAAEYVANDFGVQDVEEELAEAVKEAEERAEKAMAKQKAMGEEEQDSGPPSSPEAP